MLKLATTVVSLACALLSSVKVVAIPPSTSVSPTWTTVTSTSTISTSTSITAISSSTTATQSSTIANGGTGTSSSNPRSGTTIYNSPYLGDLHTIWINTLDPSAYAKEVIAAAGRMTNATLITKALSLVNIPTFTWFDSVAKVPNLGNYLADAYTQQTLSGQLNIVQIVIFNIPDRDCDSPSPASHGDFTIRKYPFVRVIAILEPNAIPNQAVRFVFPKCANAMDTYMQAITYAVKQLTSAGVFLYLDAAGAGILGWRANMGAAAQLYAKIFKDAGSPLLLRGLSTNVGGYNALSTTSPNPITYGTYNPDEIRYINEFSVQLKAYGFLPTNFITDQSRSGVQNIRELWGDWCNVKGAGFGMRPTSNTNSNLIDAIVWVKPGGESDGTSNSSSPYYDPKCSASDANQPAPEYGIGFQSYFEDFVKNANPPL